MEGKVTMVEFKLARATYPIDEKVEIHFRRANLKGLWEPKVGDFVGIVKIGWNSLSECKYRKMITQKIVELGRYNGDYTIIFDEQELPLDINSCYELIYVSDNLVRGQSEEIYFVLPKKDMSRPQNIYMNVDEHKFLNTPLMRSLPTQRSQVELQEPVVLPPTTTTTLGKDQTFEKIEKELMKEFERLLTNMKPSEETGVNIQKFLTGLKSIKKDEDFVRKVEELLMENGKLTNSLKQRIQELVNLRKEFQDIKSINSELLSKLNLSERKIDLLERLRDETEIGKKLKQIQSKFDEQERVREYKPVEMPEEGVKSTFLRSSIPSVQERVILPSENEIQMERKLPMGKRLSTLVDKVLREVDGTSSQDASFLKRIIEELKYENELLKAEQQKPSELPEGYSYAKYEQEPIINEKFVSLNKTVKQSCPVRCYPTLQSEETTTSSLPVKTTTLLPELPEGYSYVKYEQEPSTEETFIPMNIRSFEYPVESSEEPITKGLQQTTMYGKLMQPQFYSSKLDDDIRIKFAERLRKQLQHQLKHKIGEILIPTTTRTTTKTVPSTIEPVPFKPSSGIVEEEPRWMNLKPVHESRMYKEQSKVERVPFKQTNNFVEEEPRWLNLKPAHESRMYKEQSKIEQVPFKPYSGIVEEEPKWLNLKPIHESRMYKEQSKVEPVEFQPTYAVIGDQPRWVNFRIRKDQQQLTSELYPSKIEDLLINKLKVSEPQTLLEKPTIQEEVTLCPVCGINKPQTTNPIDFHIHVNSHFRD